MSIQNIQVGDTIPIRLQLADGAVDQYPQVEVRDNDNNLLTTISLSHAASGMYVPGTPYAMPDEVFTTLTYIVYSDVGHTTTNVKYARDLEIYYKTISVSQVMRTDTVSDVVQAAPPAEPSIEQMINYLYRKLMNKTKTDGNTDTVYAADGITELFKENHTDVGNTFTKGAYISGT